MVLRIDVVRQRLAKLEEVITHLIELGAMDRASLRLDFRTAWAVERGLHVAAETVFDMGNHILSAHFGVVSKDYEDIVARLEEVGVIDHELRSTLKGLGGFRNLLVHEYLRLDPDRVADYLARAPREFGEVALQIRRWLEGVETAARG